MLRLEILGDGVEAVGQRNVVVFEGYSHRILDLESRIIGIFLTIFCVSNTQYRQISYEFHHSYGIGITGVFGRKEVLDLCGEVRPTFDRSKSSLPR